MKVSVAAAAGVGVVTLMALGATVTAADDAADLAQALQRKYDTIHDFSADFVHTYQGGVLRKQITERGHVLIKKPGKMRWDYTTPEQKLFVSDGIRIYSYVPEDRQVVVSSVPKDDQAGAPILFLAGKGSITRDFTPSIGEVPAGSPTGSEALKLVPKSAQADYDWLLLVVDRQSLALRALVTVDTEGGRSSIAFANLKENVNPADKQFAFNIPRGVDVINDSSR
ncbi:MAG TPA: outer membrane lipoprotein chaperone LolA [Vicinamibacterales bacterium]|nr:outer membrane lipoprotein chaperone LolA [Vicinamibacterales bacterium]